MQKIDKRKKDERGIVKQPPLIPIQHNRDKIDVLFQTEALGPMRTWGSGLIGGDKCLKKIGVKKKGGAKNGLKK